MADKDYSNEDEILVRLSKGDERAFEQIYFRYSERIYRMLIFLVKDQDLADEILQDLFLKIWEGRHQIDAAQSFKAYLYRIAENLVYDSFRKISRDKKMQARLKSISTELYSHTEEDIFRRENQAILNRAIEQLSPQRKQAFILCKLEDKSYEEISQIMGISVSTVSNHLVKANKMLRECIIKPNRDTGIALLLITIIKHL